MSKDVKEVILVRQAREELTDREFYTFCSWLRENEYQNLTETEEGRLINDIFATHDQLKQFLKEQGFDTKGNNGTLYLYSKVKEVLKTLRRRKIKK